MAIFRVLLIFSGIASFLGVVWILLSLFAVRSVQNGVSQHIISGEGIVRGIEFLFAALVLGLIAFAVRPAH